MDALEAGTRYLIGLEAGARYLLALETGTRYLDELEAGTIYLDALEAGTRYLDLVFIKEESRISRMNFFPCNPIIPGKWAKIDAYVRV